MSQAEGFETMTLGSGPGASGLAWHMARTGRRTAVVERQYIGGSCPNINCLRNKNENWRKPWSGTTTAFPASR